MIKTLQKKFVFTAMSAVTILIFLMLGTINIANIVLVQREMNRTLHIIAENNENVKNPATPPGSEPPRPSMRMPQNDYDTFLSSNFFIVRFDRLGAILSTDTSRISTITDETAEELALTAYHGQSKTGKAGKFRYLMQPSRMENEMCIVFLDTSHASFSYLRVLLLSGAIGLACWGLMLIFVISLSARAIRPIAENIERQKQFVTNAGHEIKTPLAIILSNTEAMELYHGENKWSKNIKEQTSRLDGLMKNLLTLARMDENSGKIAVSDFSISELLIRLLPGFLQLMETNGISCQSDITPDIYIHADPGQIEQLLSILLDNAVKYTNSNGQIWIRLQKNGSSVRLKIQNTCESLPDVPPDKLFERFYRADVARTQKNGGYGIGLSVAYAIVAASKGSIHAAYEAGECVSFTVCF